MEHLYVYNKTFISSVAILSTPIWICSVGMVLLLKHIIDVLLDLDVQNEAHNVLSLYDIQGSDFRTQVQVGNGALFGASYIQVNGRTLIWKTFTYLIILLLQLWSIIHARISGICSKDF